jgi:hypothetical protein
MQLSMMQEQIGLHLSCLQHAAQALCTAPVALRDTAPHSSWHAGASASSTAPAKFKSPNLYPVQHPAHKRSICKAAAGILGT